MRRPLQAHIDEALNAGDTNSAAVLLADYRLRCGFSAPQRDELKRAYETIFSWAVAHNAELPVIVLGNDMDSVEGTLIGQALLSVYLSQSHCAPKGAIAKLFKGVAQGITAHGMPLDEVTNRWMAMGIAPLILAENSYFSRLQDKTFMSDLGL